MALQNKVREKLAEMFVASLNEGKLPWTACWQKERPQNAVTGKRYRGVNSFFLSLHAYEQGYSDPRWCTYLQAQKKGWQVRKGSSGYPVEYWAYFDLKEKNLLSWQDAKKLMKEEPEYANENLQLRCRISIVFNAAQIVGIPEKTYAHETNIDAIRGQRDTLLRNMRLNYREGGNNAYYSPETDTVTLPPEKSFFDIYSYACTFLHECGHATGHPDRLDRDLSGGFGSESYAKEELQAEIASAFTAQAIGLQLTEAQLQHHLDLHKAYIQGWAESVKDAPEELFRAIKDAERISDYLIEKGEFEKALNLSTGERPVAGPETGDTLDSLVASAREQIRSVPPSPARGTVLEH